MTGGFDRIAILDWSAAGAPKRGADSIWLGIAGKDGVSSLNLPTRLEAETVLNGHIRNALATGERLFLGCDFAFGWPSGFVNRLTGEDSALALWPVLAERVTDTIRNSSSYRDFAAWANTHFDGGPFWGNGLKREIPGLPRKKPSLPEGLEPVRLCDEAASGSHGRPLSPFQLAGAGAVGAQTLTGIPVLWRLKQAAPDKIAIWPFEAADSPVVIAEVWPSMLADTVRFAMVADTGAIKDDLQVRLLAAALFHMDGKGLEMLFTLPPDSSARVMQEGWVLGAGHIDRLRSGLARAQESGMLSGLGTHGSS